MNKVFMVFSTDDESGCVQLSALFNDEELARTHAKEIGQEMRPVEVLSIKPDHAVLFHAIYYSWMSTIGSNETAWSYEKDYADLCYKRDNLPEAIYWENGRGDWTLMAFGKTKEEAEIRLNNAVSTRLKRKWTFADSDGMWLRS